ncbi:AAA ATPase [hydrothermal vent metagenome]|uniref:AAA ATPase n=1 Tax=hydrothermal vent metagenome TaxID=652676 RepID=A0A3B0ULJ9_9ZZZZ
MITRHIKKKLQDQIQDGRKVILLFGARQVGKTTLIEQILSDTAYRTLQINADELRFIDILSSRDLRQLRDLTGGYDLIFIDEAQRIPEIGINLKLMADNLPDLRIIATGSSSLHLASKTREPLTGRAWTHTLYPIAFSELAHHYNRFELTDMLPERLIYGSYPDLFYMNGKEEKRDYLRNLTASYLYKDILEISNIRHSRKLQDLLRLLAFQIGQEVSFNELGTQLGMSKDTVASYIDLLEQSYVIFRLGGFSRNLRKEVSKRDKIYFWDVGVRNTIIGNLNRLSERNDIGHLWENLMICERLKWLAYQGVLGNSYFWRTYGGAEVDLVEERDGKLFGFEYKWGNKRVRPPKVFLNNYPEATFEVVTQQNFLTHVGVDL